MKKVALITGAGRGIGRAIAHRQAKDGFDVSVNDIRKEEADSVAQDISSTCKSIGIVAEISDAAQVKAMVEAVVAKFGRFDVMVSNAGIAAVAPLLEVKEAEFDKVFAINVKGTLWCAQEAARQMIKQGGGKIIDHQCCQHGRTCRLPFDGGVLLNEVQCQGFNPGVGQGTRRLWDYRECLLPRDCRHGDVGCHR